MHGGFHVLNKLTPMKTKLIILIGCALAIAPLGAEDKPAPNPAAKGKGPGGPGAPGGKGDGSFFREMDKDGDKAISKEEAGERWERLGKLDKDGDGKVTAQEMMAARPQGGPEGKGAPQGGPGKGGPEMFANADKNKDGKLSKDEVPAEMWERLSKLDKDSDGAVSKEEMAAMRGKGGPDGKGAPQGGPGKGGPEMFARADKNKDGKLSKDEVPAEMWERLSKLDKDSDGAVSKEEMAAMRGKGGPGAGPGGPGGKGGPEGGPGAMFSRFDEDKDGKLSKSEVPAEMWEKLSKADDDADGFVSKAELEKVYRERGGQGGGPRPEKKVEDKPTA